MISEDLVLKKGEKNAKNGGFLTQVFPKFLDREKRPFFAPTGLNIQSLRGIFVRESGIETEVSGYGLTLT